MVLKFRRREAMNMAEFRQCGSLEAPSVPGSTSRYNQNKLLQENLSLLKSLGENANLVSTKPGSKKINKNSSMSLRQQRWSWRRQRRHQQQRHQHQHRRHQQQQQRHQHRQQQPAGISFKIITIIFWFVEIFFVLHFWRRRRKKGQHATIRDSLSQRPLKRTIRFEDGTRARAGSYLSLDHYWVNVY